MDRKLLILKGDNIRSFDSEQYGEMFNYEIIAQGIEQCIWHVQNAVQCMEDNGIKEILLAADNTKYSLLSLIVMLEAERRNYLDDFKIYILPEYYLDKCRKENVLVESVYIEIDWRKPRLEQFQVHLTDKCNLNCKGCGHYCCIAPDANLMNVEEYIEDIKQIKDKFWGVERLYLLGGEPLLHPRVSVIMEKTRMMFPDSDIRLSTNGLLLPVQDDSFFDTVKKYNIHIEISLYEPTKKLLEESLAKLLKDKGVGETTILQGPRDQFFKKRLLKSNGDPEQAYSNCISSHCHFLRNGHLSVCPVVYLDEIICEKFDLALRFEPDGVDLYDENLNGWQINEILSRPSAACAYCNFQPEYFKWETSSAEKARLEDWVVEFGG